MKLDSSSSQRSAASSEVKPCGPIWLAARRHLAVDEPDHRVRELRVVLDEAFLCGRPLGRFLLVEEAGLREGADEVVQPVPAAPHVVDQPRP